MSCGGDHQTVVGVGHRYGQRKGCGPGLFAGCWLHQEVEDPAVQSQHRGIRQGEVALALQ